MQNIKKKEKDSTVTIITKDVKELVKARLKTLPLNVNVSIGSDGEFNRDELIEHIEKGDDIGEKIVKVDMEFLQAMKKGEFYE